MSETPSLQNHRDWLLPPPLIFGLVFALGVGLNRLWPLPPLESAGLRVAGAVFGVAGIGLGFASVRRFRRVGTTFTHLRPSRSLVMTGPYRRTRNPMYLGLSAAYLGLCLWLGATWPLLLTPIAVGLLQVWIIPAEERHLRRTFADRYDDYASQVRRWF